MDGARLRSDARGLKGTFELGIGIEADTAVEIPHQPLVHEDDLDTAATFVAELKLAIGVALQRTARLDPARPMMQRLSKKLPGDKGCLRGARLQSQNGIHIISNARWRRMDCRV